MSGLGASLITLVPDTQARAEDMNANFNALNTASTFTGSVVGNVQGNLTGNVSGNCSGSSGSCTGNAASASTVTGTVANANHATNADHATVADQDAAGNSLCPAVKSSATGGSGGVTVSHGFNGSPNAILLSPVDNIGVSWSVGSVGGSTYTAWLSVTVSFGGIAVAPHAVS